MLNELKNFHHTNKPMYDIDNQKISVIRKWIREPNFIKNITIEFPILNEKSPYEIEEKLKSWNKLDKFLLYCPIRCIRRDEKN